jgi:hypothetical protein
MAQKREDGASARIYQSGDDAPGRYNSAIHALLSQFFSFGATSEGAGRIGNGKSACRKLC